MFTHAGDAGVHRHIQRRGSGPGVQPNERVRKPRGNVNNLSIKVDRSIRNAWCSFRECTPPSSSKSGCQGPRYTRDNNVAVRLRHVDPAWIPRACHYDTLRRVHHSSLARCIGWGKISDTKTQDLRTVRYLTTCRSNDISEQNKSSTHHGLPSDILYNMLHYLANRCFFVCFSGQRRTIALKLGFTYEEHLCAVALTGSARGVQTHPLASYFLVRSSIALRLLSGEYRCLVLLSGLF